MLNVGGDPEKVRAPPHGEHDIGNPDKD